MVLTLAIAVSAKPEAGFAYSVVDPGPGYKSDVMSYVNPNMMYNANPDTMYNFNPSDYHLEPTAYTSGLVGCRNNEGKVVACIGEAEAEPIPESKLGAPEPAPAAEKAEEKSAKTDENQLAMEAA